MGVWMQDNDADPRPPSAVGAALIEQIRFTGLRSITSVAAAPPALVTCNPAPAPATAGTA